MALGSAPAPTMSCTMSWLAGAPITPAAPWTSRIADGVPDAQRVGEEEQAPRERRQHEQGLRGLDQLAAVVAVGEGARPHREEQERHPVADDGEAGERRRVELLEDHPVADDVLDVVRGHREHAEEEVPPIVGGAEGGEAGGRPRPGRRRGGPIGHGGRGARPRYATKRGMISDARMRIERIWPSRSPLRRLTQILRTPASARASMRAIQSRASPASAYRLMA